MKYLKLTTAMLAALSLSACFGSNKDKTAEAPVVEPPVAATYIDKQNTLGQLEKVALTGWDEYGGPMDSKTALPQSGSANYAGIMELPDPSTAERMNGEFELALDFANNDVTGIADNFSNSLDEVWSGQLVIEGDVDTTIAFDVDGTLTSEAGLDTIVDLYLGGIVKLKDPDNTETSEPDYIFGHLEGWMTTGSDWEEVVGGEEQNNEFFLELTDSVGVPPFVPPVIIVPTVNP